MRHQRVWLPLAILPLLSFLPLVTHADQAERIGPGDRVTISYTLSVPGSQFVMQDNVSEYIPGQNQLLPSLEQALMGMKAGEQKHVELRAEEGFGRYDEGKRITVARDRLPADAKIGDVYQTPHGQPFIVKRLTNDSAVVDFNHPLAGKDLVFDVKILKVAHQGTASSQGRDEPTIMTFNGATVEKVDPEAQQLRVRTQEGDNWQLRVTRDDLLKGVSAGDRVSLELNSDNQVKNLIKQER